MKKLIILALVALVAGAAFAETAPAFSGDFEYRTQMDFTNKEFEADDTEGSATVNLNGVVDEWSTVNAEFSADAGAGNFLELNQFNLTTDITGALGVDGPVGVSITWGAVTFEAAEYNDVAGYEDRSFSRETSTRLGAKLTFAIVEKVNVIVLVAPSSYLDPADWTSVTVALPGEAILGFEIQFLGLVEGLDANVWYSKDSTIAPIDDGPFNQIGLTLGYTSDMINVGVIAGGDLDTEVYGAGVSVQYVMDILTAGAAIGMPDFANFDQSNVGLNLTFKAVPDMLDIYAAVKIPFSSANNFGVDAGIKFYLGATTYVLGYDYENAGFEGPTLTTAGGMYLKVKASF